MSTEKVFWTEPYLAELNAHVTSADSGRITVDRTIAYAFSGGQSSDCGTMNGYRILKAEMDGKEIYYTLEGNPPLSVGDEICIKIDWVRRYRLMKLHFAAEIILELVNKLMGKPSKIGAHITDSKARLDFVWEDNISGMFPYLLSEASRIIEADLPVISDFSDIKNERRYWEVKDFGRVPCCGTHVRTTGELGPIRLKRENIGKGKERIEITLVNP